MKLTKNDMARVIVAALYNMPAIPAADDRRVIRKARVNTVDVLRHEHKLAMAAIESRPKARFSNFVAVALDGLREEDMP